MRVLFLESATGWTGGARAFFAAGRALAARTHDVAFACPSGSALERRASAAAFPVYPVDEERPRARPTRSAIEAHFAEVVFAQDTDAHLAAAMAARRTAHTAIVRRVPAGAVFPSDRRTRLAERMLPAAYLVTAPTAGADAIPTVPTIHATVGIDPPPRPADRSSGSGNTLHLACLATDDDVPSALEVIRSLRLLAERHSGCGMTMMGMARRLDECRVLAAAMGVADRIRWVPENGTRNHALAGATVAWVLAGGDAGAFGCLDAMAHGLPVFAPRSAVLERYLDESLQDLLFPALRPAEMAAAVDRLLAKPEDRARRSRVARARVSGELTELAMAGSFEHAARLAHSRERKRS